MKCTDSEYRKKMRSSRRAAGFWATVIWGELVVIAAVVVWHWRDIVAHLARSPAKVVLLAIVTSFVIVELSRGVVAITRAWLVMIRGG